MRISDWSSDVCSSDLKGRHDNPRPEIIAPVREWGCTIACTQLSERCQAAAVDNTGYLESVRAYGRRSGACCAGSVSLTIDPEACRIPEAEELQDRKRVVEGKSVSVRFELGCSRRIK